METTDQLLAELSDYWDKDHESNLYKLADIFNGSFEQISAAADTVEDWREISQAKGKTLDMFGKDLKAYRINNDDNLYRFTIGIQKLMAKANGTTPNIRHIAETALQKQGAYNVFQTRPRHVSISIPLDDVTDTRIERLLLKNLKQLVVLGVWLDQIDFQAQRDNTVYIGSCITSDEIVHLQAI